MTYRIIISVYFLLLPTGIMWSAEPDTGLERQVSNIYLDGGDFVEVIPELIQQLEVRAIIDYGYIGGRDVFGFETGLDEDVVDKPFFPSDDLQPFRRVAAYERETGSVLEIVDEFCRLRRDFFWGVNDGILYIFRGPQDGKALDFLDVDLGDLLVPEQPASWKLFHTITEKLAQDAPRIGLTWSTFRIGIQDYSHPCKQTLRFSMKHATIRQIMHSSLEQNPNFMWTTGHTPADIDSARPKGSFSASIRFWHPSRRDFDMRTLFRGLNEDYDDDFFGYPDGDTCKTSFRNEIKRRYHFSPETTINEILNHIGLLKERVTDPEETGEENTIRWLISLDNKRLNETLINMVLNCPDDEKRRLYFIGNASPIPTPWHDSRFLWVWEKAAKEDKNEDVRLEAQAFLEYMDKYQRWLDNKLKAGTKVPAR